MMRKRNFLFHKLRFSNLLAFMVFFTIPVFFFKLFEVSHHLTCLIYICSSVPNSSIKLFKIVFFWIFFMLAHQESCKCWARQVRKHTVTKKLSVTVYEVHETGHNYHWLSWKIWTSMIIDDCWVPCAVKMCSELLLSLLDFGLYIFVSSFRELIKEAAYIQGGLQPE